MSRGISELQRWILLVSLENGFISTKEIMSGWWDWEPTSRGARKTAVGLKRYNKAHASISRSISRLWQRGLVIIWKSLTESTTAVSLTPAGKELVERILNEETEDGNNG